MIPGWLKSAWAVVAGVVLLLIRYFKRKDASEPQKILDQARTDSATGDDAALNADLDDAADRLRDKNGA